MARASSGAINYLVRRGPDGELLTWPIGELTLIDRSDLRRPANELAVAYLKTAYHEANIDFPEAFAKSGELKALAEDDELDYVYKYILDRKQRGKR